MAEEDANPPASSPHRSGHRARLRNRIFAGQGAGLHDHELVEYLLALAIPRRDTKALAKKLIEEFGGFSGVLVADADALANFPGMGETSVAALKIVQLAALHLISAPVRQQPVLASWQALLDYLRADMAHLAHERVRVLHLDSKNRLIRDELVSEGSVDQAAIYTREVIKRALALWDRPRSFWSTITRAATAHPADRISRLQKTSATRRAPSASPSMTISSSARTGICRSGQRD